MFPDMRSLYLGREALSGSSFKDVREVRVSALVRVSVAVMKHRNPKASWGGKGLLG